MIPLGEVVAGIHGAWRLARRDPKGMDWFDPTIRGYWHSYYAAVLVLPAFVLVQLISGGFGPDPGLRQYVIWAIAYVLGWVVFPLLMIRVADSLDRWPLYLRFITAYNWASVIQMAAMLVVAVLAHLFPGAATMLLAQGVTILLLVYRSYVAHVALAVTPVTAAGIVLMDVLVSGVIQVISSRLAGS